MSPALASLTRQKEIVSVEFDEYSMAHEQLERRGPSSQRALAAALAALLVLAQCLAVAHHHPRPSASRYSSVTVILDDGGLCALCLFHQYSPSLWSTAPVLFAPTTVNNVDLYAAQSWPLYAFNSYLLGRSPPALA